MTRAAVPRLPSFFSARAQPVLSPLPLNLHISLRLGIGLHKRRSRTLSVAVRASGDPRGNSAPLSPLEFESPVGLLLAQILQTHPHLLPAAIDQQLENLKSEQDESSSSQDVLYRRIAEVKQKERRRALEEIIYSLVVQKFIDNNILMIPKLPPASLDPTGRVDFWPNQEQKLESVHSPEAFEMIISHLSIILGEREVGPLESIVQISNIKLGKLYAASVMYGYFLRRVDERYQLEQRMNTTAANEGDEKAYRLRTYVMYLDGDTLQRYATIRSKEAISLIEKQTQALFGRPDIKIADDGSLDASNDEVVSLTFSGLTMLVLEAVAFGSFLWDAECYVESKFHFLSS